MIQDYRGQKCGTPTFKLSSEQWKNMDYNSDLCTAQSIIDWMNKDAGKPFFGIMFTAMTHYPYITDSPMFSKMAPSADGNTLVHYSDDQKFNAYLNALKVGDTALGEILESLKQSGKLDSTLVVWMGEFGRTPVSQGANGQDHSRRGFSLWLAGGGVRAGYAHGATDEFGYESVDKVVSMHDLDPTLLWALGLDHQRLTFDHEGRRENLTDSDLTRARVVSELLA